MAKAPLIILLLLVGLNGAAAEPPEWHECQSSPVKALHFITVAEARLRRADCSTENLLAPPLQLEFQYFRDVPGSAFAEAASTLIERNLPEQQYRSLKPRIKRFNSHYRDIDEGDTYRLTYLPDGQLTLSLNGEPLTAEAGHTFATSYLLIWFGREPYSRRLKGNLLGSS